MNSFEEIQTIIDESNLKELDKKALSYFFRQFPEEDCNIIVTLIKEQPRMLGVINESYRRKCTAFALEDLAAWKVVVNDQCVSLRK